MIIQLFSATFLSAQTFIDGGNLIADGQVHQVSSARYYNTYYRDLPKEFTLPASASGYLYLRAEGADGGKVHWPDGTCKAHGGDGATMMASFQIGNGSGMIPAGSTIRMLIGLHGENRKVEKTSAGRDGAGGGGGTGVLFKAPGRNEWTLLMVSGAGSGGVYDGGGLMGLSATRTYYGRPGQTSTSGADGDPCVGNGTMFTEECGAGAGGKDGFVGGFDHNAEDYSYPGGGLFLGAEEDGNIKAGWTGASGWEGARTGTSPNYQYDYTVAPQGGNGGESRLFGGMYIIKGGGWGFGGGGVGGGNSGSGGGGGYSGGGAANDQAAGGGGSYLNTMAVKSQKLANSSTFNPGDGFVAYRISSSATLPGIGQIALSYRTNKCVDNRAGGLTNGNNILIWDCGDSNANQAWALHESQIQLAGHPNKCLDLDHSNTANGTNIQLWDCNNTWAQYWIYDGLTRNIRSGVNLEKCLDLVNAITTNGNNIQIWDCKEINAQRWTIDGATTVSSKTTVKHIVPVLAPGFAVHSHTGAESGSNIQLWTKDNTNQYEQWYFDGLAFKLINYHNLCIDLKSSSTSNGSNIQLYDCNNTKAQKWIYDGMTQSIRSVINPNKCMQIEKNTDGVYGKRSNVEIHDCNGSQEQLFLIQE